MTAEHITDGDAADNIRVKDMPDLLPINSEWTEQEPDGSSYISNELLASVEPGVLTDVAVPVNPKDTNDDDQN